jgi:hypothetical protein
MRCAMEAETVHGIRTIGDREFYIGLPNRVATRHGKRAQIHGSFGKGWDKIPTDLSSACVQRRSRYDGSRKLSSRKAGALLARIIHES